MAPNTAQERPRRPRGSVVEVGESAVHGQGVFATRAFAPGEVVVEIDDSRVVTDDAPLDETRGEFEHHCDWLGDTVVLMQEPDRYINHCCEPNSHIDTAADGSWRVFAYRAISVGEEITYDYCIDSDGDTVWTCECGHPRCREVHTSSFFDLPDAKLAEYLPLLSPWFRARHSERLRSLTRALNRRGFSVDRTPPG